VYLFGTVQVGVCAVGCHYELIADEGFLVLENIRIPYSVASVGKKQMQDEESQANKEIASVRVGTRQHLRLWQVHVTYA
jgi:hypothetical protein